MLRLWCSCCLIVGMTALAQDGSPEGTSSAWTAVFGEPESRTAIAPTIQLMSAESSIASSDAADRTIKLAKLFNQDDRQPQIIPVQQIQAELIEPETTFASDDEVDLDYRWRVLPKGLIYRSYLAGEKEPRFSSVWLTDQNGNLVWETALGGRFAFIRHGTGDAVRPEGWELAFEGAALPRVAPDLDSSPLIACDYRMGLLSTWRRGPTAYKAGYYHLSSHLGDEFLLNNPGFVRLNYVRDAAIVGLIRDITPELQVYGEAAYAFNHEDGALPWEFQYGIQYKPMVPGLFGAPFGAINGHTRQDFGYSTSINVVAGWQWWSEESGQTFRLGLQYYDGPSLQYSFVNKRETLMGWGIWFDY